LGSKDAEDTVPISDKRKILPLLKNCFLQLTPINRKDNE